MIEPSFGIGRILYCLFEHAFYTREGDDQVGGRLLWLATGSGDLHPQLQDDTALAPAPPLGT